MGDKKISMTIFLMIFKVEKVADKKAVVRRRPITVPLLGPEYKPLCARLQKIAIEAGLSDILF